MTWQKYEKIGIILTDKIHSSIIQKPIRTSISKQMERPTPQKHSAMDGVWINRNSGHVESRAIIYLKEAIRSSQPEKQW